jgi:hypothetical protein
LTAEHVAPINPSAPKAMPRRIIQLVPARERIRVLLEFLGRSLQMEVPVEKVLPRLSGDPPPVQNKVAVQRNGHLAFPASRGPGRLLENRLVN